jgi:hypothetical protein
MITLDVVIEEAKKNDRVCPQTPRWQELYEILPEKQRKGMGWEPPLPLILAAWWDTPALSKMMRLREHIEWADKHGCLDKVYEFLCQLPESDWHHIGD